MTTQQMTAVDLLDYLERRFERAMETLDKRYFESDMSEYEYQNEIEMLKVQIFQGMVAVCDLENQQTKPNQTKHETIPRNDK
jgi:prefoldin subunit 5